MKANTRDKLKSIFNKVETIINDFEDKKSSGEINLRIISNSGGLRDFNIEKIEKISFKYINK